jgi:uncharacterized cysteine cluster protein YcgN (CxxCxxCC family)
MSGEPPFWRTKTLPEMTDAEWESLCDGCGRCCQIKLEDEDTGEVVETRLVCRLLDLGTCRCSAYATRHAEVPDCVRLDAEKAGTLAWLPETCAYRLVAAGQDLPWWHPLVSGSAETVHQAGASVRAFATSEAGVPLALYPRYIRRRRRRK